MSMMREDLQIENARIMFRNFRGEPDKFNANGKRNFCVFIDEDQADGIAALGWNVKRLSPREDNPNGQAYIPVEVQFAFYPPSVYLIANGSMTKMDEDSIGTLDWAEIEKVDLILRPYEWDVSGRTGVKAYLKKMWVTLKEDNLSKKYEQYMSNPEFVIGADGKTPF